MYISVSPFGSISYGTTPLNTLVFQSIQYNIDYEQGTLTVDGKLDSITYCTKEKDSVNGLTSLDIEREAGKRLVQIAKDKGYKFYKEI